MTTTFNHKITAGNIGALEYTNQMRLHQHTQANIRARLEEIHEAYAPMTAAGLALIRDVLRFAREEYTKVGHVVPSGGVIDHYKLDRYKPKRRHHCIRAKLYYDDLNLPYARYMLFRSLRTARVWAKSVIAMGIVDLDFEVTVPRPVEKINLTLSIEPEL